MRFPWRRDLPSFPIVAIGVLATLFAIAGQSQAGDAQPKRRDTRESVKPRVAHYTTSIEPATARPGDTVTYKVAVKVEKPWHIYAWAAEQAEEGPRATQFDLFDTDGLVVGDTWTPEHRPIRKKVSVWKDLDAVEFHEDEVVWSVPLTIPADAPAGKKVIQNQIYLHLCHNSACLSPAYVTLPPAEVVIEAPKPEARRAPVLERLAPLALTAVHLQDDKPAPRRRDSRIKPPEVTYEASIEPETAKPGDTVTYKVAVTVDEPWHIYAWAAEQPKEGPRSTQFDVFNASGFTPGNEWTSDDLPIRKKEPAFPSLDAVDFHEKKVVWSIPLTIPKDAAAGTHSIQSQIYFQICNEQACKPPAYVTLPAAEVTVVKECAAVLPSRAGFDTWLALMTIGMMAPQAAAVEAAPAAAAATKAPEAVTLPAGELGEKIKEGFIPFLIYSLSCGLLAMFMPCVWPMVPITVNFFVKQSHAKGGQPVGLAIVYCLSIIGIFTALGLIVSIFLGGAGATTKLGNNPWVNLVFALAFFAFGLSLLGLFEIRLPSALLNASSAAESRGGLIGVIFMAVTLTITSFTCTAPLVGGLLVLATRGQYFYPIVGLLAFSSMLALPFFLVALMPSRLSRLPRSGDWMNTIKVVGGLLEIGAAFKFLNTAEVSFQGGNLGRVFFDSNVVLSIWVVMAIVCGIYLIGLFRTDHDLDDVRVGPARLMMGIAFLAFGLYLAPALFGTPPQSRLYREIVGIFPAGAGDLDVTPRLSGEVVAGVKRSLGDGVLAASGTGSSPSQAMATGPAEQAVKATSTDPKVAVREERELVGVSWGLSYDAALEEAKAQNKPVLIDFTGVNCANCRTMEQSVIPRPEVVGKLKNFVRVRLYTDYVPIHTLDKETTEFLGEDNLVFEQELVGQTTSPFYVVVDPTGKVLNQQGFDASPENFVQFLQKGLDKFAGATEKVASK